MKVERKLLFCLFILFFAVLFFSVAYAGPNSGEGVYRDMERRRCEPFGHAGMSIGNEEVIHMTRDGCCKSSFSGSFESNYWGSVSQGDFKAAGKRAKIVKEILDLKPKVKYNFFSYKNYPSKFRCDGLIEYCFEKADGNIIWDWGWFTMAPRTQWQSGRVQRNGATSLGDKRYKNSLASDYHVDSTAAAIIMLAPMI